MGRRIIFSSLKKERILNQVYLTRDKARAGIFDYIELRCYRRYKRHPHVKSMNPKAFEDVWHKQA